jgi:hypothetical protein
MSDPVFSNEVAVQRALAALAFAATRSLTLPRGRVLQGVLSPAAYQHQVKLALDDIGNRKALGVSPTTLRRWREHGQVAEALYHLQWARTVHAWAHLQTSGKDAPPVPTPMSFVTVGNRLRTQRVIEWLQGTPFTLRALDTDGKELAALCQP